MSVSRNIFPFLVAALVTAGFADAAPGRGARALAQLIFPEPAQRPGPAAAPAEDALATRIDDLGKDFNGEVGIAVKDLQTGWTTGYRANSLYPQQSVSKFWVTLTALDEADRGELDLNAPVTLRPGDLTLFNQPIAALVKRGSFTTTIDDLIHRAMQHSDNTANDFTLHRIGGPEAVRAFLRRKGIEGVRFGPGERLLQSATAGLAWRPEYAVGNAFYAARDRLPFAARQAALARYLADPMDGAMPSSIVEALGRLKKGELLAPATSGRLLDIMSHTATGPQRLHGGLEPGWMLSHKTGTGQILGAVSTGYNDIGVITGPDGRSYAIAIMIRKTTVPIPARMALMQSVVHSVIDYDRGLGGYGVAGGGRGERARAFRSER